MPATSGRRRRLVELLDEAGAELFLGAHGPTVTWLTGYVPEDGLVLSAYETPALALVDREGHATLVVSELEAEAAEATGLNVVVYPFSFSAGNRPGVAADAVVRQCVGRRTATERWALPATIAEGLDAVDVGAAVHRARALKDPDEIERIRASIALCDVGQAAARAAAQPGTTEIELWGAVQAAVERAAGAPVQMRCDLLSGPRSAAGGGPPTARTIAAGDSVLFDLFLRHEGYWGDSSATFAVGAEPSAALRERHATVQAALQAGVAAMRPGSDIRAVEQAIRGSLRYGHLSGHGIGTALHEEPRVALFAEGTLQPGMVVTVEPGVYDDDPGVRLEQVVLIGEHGPEILSRHAVEL